MDYVYQDGALVPIESAMGLSTGGAFYDSVAQGLALYGQYMNAKQLAQMNDLNYQQAQLALVEKYKPTQPGASVTTPGAAAGQAQKLSPVMLLLIGVAVLYVLKKV